MTNPYEPTSLPESPETTPQDSKEPFSHQAAKFSAYAPFILLLLGMCVQGQVKAHAGTPTGMQLALALGAISLLTTAAAGVLGCVGLVGGIARRATWTIAMASIGILLNLGILAVWVTLLFGIGNRPPAPRSPTVAESKTWSPVHVEAYRLKFEMPGSVSEGVATSGDKGQFTVATYQSKIDVAHFGLSITDLGAADLPSKHIADPAQALNGIVDQWALSLKGRVTDRRAVTVGAQVGVEAEVEFSPGAKRRDGTPVVGLGLMKACFFESGLASFSVVLDKNDYEANVNEIKDKARRFFDSAAFD